MNLPKALEDLVSEFMKYPGIGRKTAERYALFTINNMSEEDTANFGTALLNIKNQIRHCPICGHLTDREKCNICESEIRDHSTIMVVETSKDVFTIEKSGEFKGYYHVLNGAISPMDGIGPDDINISSLWPRVINDNVKELIIATSSTQEGETTAMYIRKAMKDLDVVVTRIGYGVPVGLNLEYADDLTLSKAIENRRKM